MKNFVRGSGINLAVTFYDHHGNVVQPGGANVTVSYLPKNNTQISPPRTFITYPLVAPTAPATEWTLDWDSSVSSANVVDCHAFTTDPGNVATVDFQFRLTANRANKELAGDDDSLNWYGYLR